MSGLFDSLYPIQISLDPRELDFESDRVSLWKGVSTLRSAKQGQPDLKVHPLGPRKPEIREKSRGLLLLLALAYAFAIVAAIVITCIPENRNRAGTTDDCYELTSDMSAMEARFHIDITVAGHLSFSHAKLIDLSWDIGVGQGGRLLHGWILYHLAARTITWILETSALPYSVLFDLLFYADSILSLWSLFGLLWGNRRAGLGILVRSLCLALAVAQVLFFATIWSAATGYQSPGEVTYAMPDQGWVTKDSDDLTICWNPESQRPELTGVIDGPILGPKYSTAFSSFTEKNDKIMDYSQISEDYANIQAYLQSKDAVRVVLEGLGGRRRITNITLGLAGHRRTNNMTLVWNETAGFNSILRTSDDLYKTMIPKSYDILHNTIEDNLTESSWLPTTIEGWQLLGVRQNQTAPARDMFWAYGNILTSSPKDREKQQFRRSTFRLNHSISYHPGVAASIPYNSTFWYKGTEISLQAPFLGFMNCTWLQFKRSDASISPPDCLCYKGELVLQDFRVGNHKACTGGAEYVWGFSHFITLIGLILELVWCLVCGYLYLSTNIGIINLYDRSAVGTLRNALDFAEVVKEELGDDICLYTNKQLMEALSDSHPIGYATKERSDGITHLGLVPVKDGGAVRRRTLLDPKKFYG